MLGSWPCCPVRRNLVRVHLFAASLSSLYFQRIDPPSQMTHACIPAFRKLRPQLPADGLDSRSFVTLSGLHHCLSRELAIYKASSGEFVCCRDSLLRAFLGQSPTAGFLGLPGRTAKDCPLFCLLLRIAFLPVSSSHFLS